MAEWLKALVLKTRDGDVRRFESCPFRQVKIANLGVFFLLALLIVALRKKKTPILTILTPADSIIDSSQGSHRAERGPYILPYFLTKTVK